MWKFVNEVRNVCELPPQVEPGQTRNSSKRIYSVCVPPTDTHTHTHTKRRAIINLQRKEENYFLFSSLYVCVWFFACLKVVKNKNHFSKAKIEADGI